jgi:hypothetical protein
MHPRKNTLASRPLSPIFVASTSPWSLAAAASFLSISRGALRMKPTVYIETTIPSFYYSDRTETDMVVVKDWTRDWWREESLNYELVSSVAVIDELKQGDHSGKEDKLKLLEGVRMLELAVETDEIVETYLRHKLMPKDLSGDARHLAVASFHRCDYLLTWNCRHIANANKIGHIRRINGMLGLPTPELVTPLELVSENK